MPWGIEYQTKASATPKIEVQPARVAAYEAAQARSMKRGTWARVFDPRGRVRALYSRDSDGRLSVVEYDD
jgi:hypothetical protein